MKIAVGVTGGIAAFKTATVVSSLVKSGHDVRVMMTESALQFVGEVTFRSLSGNPVVTRMFDPHSPYTWEHISLAQWADVVLVAPATANCLGKLASGLTDDIITCTIYACDCPVVLCPAMNTRMWEHPVVQDNARRLRELGYHQVGPAEGRMACGTVGAGRMSEPEEIVEAVKKVMGRNIK